VAYVLATRDSCTEDRCETFDLFSDNGRVVSNLHGHSFEIRLERANAAWAAAKQPQVVAAPQPSAPATPQPQAASAAAPGHPPASSAANFPSASSIPAVSIMNNEPGYTGQNGVDDSKAEQKPASKRPGEKPAPKRVQGAAPIPIAPTADASGRVQ
jgi:hypothetical protein